MNITKTKKKEEEEFVSIFRCFLSLSRSRYTTMSQKPISTDQFDQYGDTNDDIDYEDIDEIHRLVSMRYDMEDDGEPLLDDNEFDDEQALSQQLQQSLTTNDFYFAAVEQLSFDEDSLQKIKVREEFRRTHVPSILDEKHIDEFRQFLLEQHDNEIESMLPAVEQCQSIVRLIYFRSIVHGQKSLWSNYEQWSTSSNEINKRPRCPKSAKLNLFERRSTTDFHSPEQNQRFLEFVRHLLTDIEQVNGQLEQAWSSIVSQSTNMIHADRPIDIYLRSLFERTDLKRIARQYQLKEQLLVNDDHDRYYQEKFFEHKPTVEQERTMEHLYDVQFQLEKVKCQRLIYQTCLTRNCSTKSWNNLNPQRHFYVDRIDDKRLRHRLLNRHEQILQRTKTELCQLSLQTLDILEQQYQTDFDRSMSKLWQNYRQWTSMIGEQQHERLTRTMIELIDKRLANVRERFRYIVEYHQQCFFC